RSPCARSAGVAAGAAVLGVRGEVGADGRGSRSTDGQRRRANLRAAAAGALLSGRACVAARPAVSLVAIGCDAQGEAALLPSDRAITGTIPGSVTHRPARTGVPTAAAVAGISQQVGANGE